MKVVIEINTDNAAFEDENELPNILRKLAGRIAMSGDVKTVDGQPIFDTNGNKVGKVIAK